MWMTAYPGIKNLPANARDTRDTGLNPGLGRFPGVRKGTTLQFSCLRNPMDRGAWWATVHGVAKSQTRLSDLAHTTHTHESLSASLALHY